MSDLDVLVSDPLGVEELTDTLDDILPDAMLGMDRERGEVESDSVLLDDVAKYFSDIDTLLTEQEKLADMEEMLIEEGYFEESVDIPALGGYAPDAHSTELVEEFEVSSGEIARRMMVPLPDTLSTYVTIAADVQRHVKSQEYDDKSSRAIADRLIEFYKSHNDILPDISLTNDFYAACDEIYPGVPMRQRYASASLETYIISEIQNQKSVRAIVDVLKRFIEKGQFVDGRGRRFSITSTNEVKVLQFLNKLRTFYESDITSYQDSLSRRALAQIEVDNSIQHFLAVGTKESTENSVAEFTYPQTIYLDTGTFICGECSEEQDFNEPFLKSMLMNSSINEFLMILPTMEVCTICGYRNILPSNYYNTIVTEIKKNFAQDFSVKTLRERLEALSDNFGRYSYDLPKAAILEALPRDLKTYFTEKGVAKPLVFDEERTDPLDKGQSVAAYKARIAELESASPSRFAKLRGARDAGLLSSSSEISRKLVSAVYSDVTKSFCVALGVDYTTLKSQAVNSFLFFLDDYVPFIMDPSAVVKERAGEVVYGIKPDSPGAGRVASGYATALTSLEKSLDYFAFVPIIDINSGHPSIGYYGGDEQMKALIDCASDAMIIYSLKEDLLDVCVAGTAYPFPDENARLRSVLSASRKNPLLKKFNSSLTTFARADGYLPDGHRLGYVTELLLTRYHWLWKEQMLLVDHSALLKAFRNRDIYDAVKIITESDKYAELRPILPDFSHRVLNEAKLEFYYKDLFPEVDFTLYDAGDISIFWEAEVDSGESFEQYLDKIRGVGYNKGQGKVRRLEWFESQIPLFFKLLREDFLSHVNPEDILFMDIMKGMTVYGPRTMTQAFSAGTGNLAASVTPYEMPRIDKDLEFARQVVYQFPYQSGNLQLIVSGCSNPYDVEGVVALLLCESDSVAEELVVLPSEVKDLLRKHLNLDIG